MIGAGDANIKIKFKTLPHDMIAFSEEVNQLCWELQQVYEIDGYGGDESDKRRAVEQLAQIIRHTHKVYLWWD